MCLRERPRAVLAGHRLAVHLRRDDVLLAHAEEPRQDAAGHDLALAAVVDVRGVEERDPALDRAADDRLRCGLVERPGAALVLAVAHHPEAEARDAQPGVAEVHVVHRASTLPRASYVGATVPAPVDSRTTSFVASSMRSASTRWFSSRRISKLTAIRPISASGWRTVVSPGTTISASSESSKPTTERSSGCSAAGPRRPHDSDRTGCR